MRSTTVAYPANSLRTQRKGDDLASRQISVSGSLRGALPRSADSATRPNPTAAAVVKDFVGRLIAFCLSSAGARAHRVGSATATIKKNAR